MGFFLSPMKRRKWSFHSLQAKTELQILSPGWQPPIYRSSLHSLGTYTEIHLYFVAKQKW